jgi:hypothetical protein
MLKDEILIKSIKYYEDKHGINQCNRLIKKIIVMLENQRMSFLHEQIKLLQKEINYPCEQL